MPTVVGFLGRLSIEKDPDAAYRLAVAMPTVQVVAVGDGPLRATLAANPPSNLRVVGPDHDRGSVLAACDLILVPSRYESFGLVIAEAAWLGVPVISTPVGIAAIEPSLTRPIPIGASGAVLAAAVAADLADPVGTAKRASAAQRYAQTYFTPDRFARDYAAQLALLSPPLVASKINAVLSGTIARAAISPRLDLDARVDACPFSDGTCGCQGRKRPCSHPGRDNPVDRAYCLACQNGDFDQ